MHQFSGQFASSDTVAFSYRCFLVSMEVEVIGLEYLDTGFIETFGAKANEMFILGRGSGEVKRLWTWTPGGHFPPLDLWSTLQVSSREAAGPYQTPI